MPNVDALAPLRLGSIRTFSGAVDGNLYSHNPLPVAGMVKSALDRVIAQMGNRDRSRSLSARAAISFKECTFLFPVATVPCRNCSLSSSTSNEDPPARPPRTRSMGSILVRSPTHSPPHSRGSHVDAANSPPIAGVAVHPRPSETQIRRLGRPKLEAWGQFW